MTDITVRSEQACFGGTQGFYSHESATCGGTMNFALYQPPQARAGGKLPLVTFLSGLTCTDENFTTKAGAQRVAAELGVMVLAPDTSPRGAGYPGEDDSYDFGSGAGFYLDATETPWSERYRMYSYITRELPALIAANFAADMSRQGITGHSMGGHGAITIHLKNPETYRSVSAFSPICAPMSGAKILIDQGAEDGFLEEQLLPQVFVEACENAGQAVELRMQPGYDHSYYFIQTFMEDHLRHHAATLLA